jgi:hypothetical protein
MMKKLSKNFKRGIAKTTWFGALLLVAGIASLQYEQSVSADNNYFAVTPGTAFSQDWTNVGLITANDDWSGVPSINGFLGDDTTTTTANIDTQTIVVPFVTIDVIANQLSVALTNGGVAEFDGIANPVVALQGSGTADFPHIDIRLDTSNCSSTANRLNITYDIRDIDSTIDDAVQQAALQYRVGNTGNYTNVPAGYVPDATTGPSIATLVTPIAVTLPPVTQGVSQLHVRIMTSNAGSNDEWIGIDNIKVVCAVPSAANASLGGRVQTSNGNGISKARVQISGGGLTQPLFALTNPFGYYTFSDLPAGQSYSVSVIAKGRTFNQPTQIVTLGDDLSNVNFIALD